MSALSDDTRGEAFVAACLRGDIPELRLSEPIRLPGKWLWRGALAAALNQHHEFLAVLLDAIKGIPAGQLLGTAIQASCEAATWLTVTKRGALEQLPLTGSPTYFLTLSEENYGGHHTMLTGGNAAARHVRLFEHREDAEAFAGGVEPNQPTLDTIVVAISPEVMP